MSYNNSDVRVGGRGDLIASYSTYKTKVLPNNLVDHRNVLTQLMMNTPNTKYVIKWDYVLNESITLPAGCLIEFDGGSIRNDNGNEFTLTGNDTIVIFYQDRDKVVKDVELLGNFIFNGSIDTADEEDITGRTGVLKFADKDYDPENFSGLGRVYLRKNIGAPVDPNNNIWCYKPSTDELVYLMYRYQGVYYHIYDEGTGKGLVLHNNIVKETDEYNVANLPEPAQEHNMPYIKNGDRLEVTLPDNTVVDDSQINNTEIFYYVDEEGDESQYAGKNILTQDMISKSNTIYIIQYDFTLGEDITVPENCVLEFDGGSISNGTIIGNNTDIFAPQSNCIFNNVYIEGTWCVKDIYSYWFNFVAGEYHNNIMKALCSLQNSNYVNNIYLYNSEYRFLPIVNEDNFIYLVSNTNLFLNSNIIVESNEFGYYSVIDIVGTLENHVKNITITGGHIIGDVESHTGSTGEYGHGINIKYAENVKIKNLISEKMWGDGFYIGGYADEGTFACKNITFDNIESSKNRRQGISVTCAFDGFYLYNSTIKETGDIAWTSPSDGIDFEANDLKAIQKNIIIDSCYFDQHGHGTDIEFMRGDYAQGYIENIYINNCVFGKPVIVDNLRTAKINHLEFRCDIFNFVCENTLIYGYLYPSGKKSNNICDLYFNNCILTGVNANMPLTVAEAPKRYNVFFNNCTLGKSDYWDEYSRVFYFRNSCMDVFLENCNITHGDADSKNDGCISAIEAKKCTIGFYQSSQCYYTSIEDSIIYNRYTNALNARAFSSNGLVLRNNKIYYSNDASYVIILTDIIIQGYTAKSFIHIFDNEFIGHVTSQCPIITAGNANIPSYDVVIKRNVFADYFNDNGRIYAYFNASGKTNSFEFSGNSIASFPVRSVESLAILETFNSFAKTGDVVFNNNSRNKDFSFRRDNQWYNFLDSRYYDQKGAGATAGWILIGPISAYGTCYKLIAKIAGRGYEANVQIQNASGKLVVEYIRDYGSLSTLNQFKCIDNNLYVKVTGSHKDATLSRILMISEKLYQIQKLYFVSDLPDGTETPIYIIRHQAGSGTRTAIETSVLEKGFLYFDEDLGSNGKPVWWNGTAWVDATGTPV